MPDTLTFEIVTPEAVQHFDSVEIVTLPGTEGRIGVYPHHMALMTQMVPGEIMVRKDGHEVFIASGGGLIEVTSRRVSVLTDLAVQADRIDEAKAEEARLRAEARLHEKLSAEEHASVNASLARSLAQLRVKRRQRR